ncbi:MAG: NADH-quinone oxidoreductase subunit NuoE [Bacillota bacterium]
MELLESLEKDRSNLIKAIQMVQKKRGYVSNESIKNISKYFDIPTVEVEGVLTFYAQFKRTAPGEYKIAVCDGTACHIKGSSRVKNWVIEELGIDDGETTEDGLFSMETVACLGCCSLAPVVSINGKVYGKLDRKSLLKIIKDYKNRGEAQ